MTDKEITKLFLWRLTEQGFNIQSIEPFLELTYRERDGDTEAVRFDIKYDDLTPICQYARVNGHTITPRDEWFVPGDIIFDCNQKDTHKSFYDAFKYVSVSYVLGQLGISEPWKVAK